MMRVNMIHTCESIDTFPQRSRAHRRILNLLRAQKRFLDMPVTVVFASIYISPALNSRVASGAQRYLLDMIVARIVARAAASGGEGAEGQRLSVLNHLKCSRKRFSAWNLNLLNNYTEVQRKVQTNFRLQSHILSLARYDEDNVSAGLRTWPLASFD